MIKHFLLSFVLLLTVPFSACAQDNNTSFVAGKDYEVITPAIYQPNKDKIDVTEFFWYGCIHCYHLEPHLIKWKKTLPEDVVVTGSPVIWGQGMDLHAKAYYAAKLLNAQDTVHPALFRAMNVDRDRLLSQAAIGKIFTANGVSEADFNKAFRDFGVNHQVTQAEARAKSAQVTGTPQVMVNGKYRTSARMAGGVDRMFEVVNYLIEKERAAMAKADKAA